MPAHGRIRTALVLGSVGLDVISLDRADDVLTRGTRSGTRSGTARAGEPATSVSVGCSGAGIAVRLAAAGWTVALAAVVGDDLAGDVVREQLHARGVETELLEVRAGRRTPLVFQTVQLGAAAPVFSNTCPQCGTSHDAAAQVADATVLRAIRAWATRASLVIADRPDPLALDCFRRTRGLRWSEDHPPPVDVEVDVLKWSASEPPATAATTATADVVTDGERGISARWRPGDWWTVAAAAPRDVVDTMGAGDAFTAAAAAALAGRPRDAEHLREALEAGAAAAAAACGANAALGDLQAPHLPEALQRRLEAVAFWPCCGGRGAPTGGSVPVTSGIR